MLNQHYTYLLIDVACILIPLIASFHPKSAFYKEWKWFVPANLIVAALFLVWDALFTMRGIWGFNEAYITGIKLFNLPVEEVLFFICIPYACTYTFYVWHKYVYIGLRSTSLLSYFLVTLLIVLAIININKAYTATTFILLAGVLLYLQQTKAGYLADFYVVYTIMLIPFFISNGLLTGSWLAEPIVWYNNAENLGVRLGTIPVEDTMYGMLLLLLNVSVYKWMRQKGTISVKQNKLKVVTPIGKHQ